MLHQLALVLLLLLVLAARQEEQQQQQQLKEEEKSVLIPLQACSPSSLPPSLPSSPLRLLSSL